MKRIILTVIFCALAFCAVADTDISMPAHDVTGINNGYSLAALCISTGLSFVVLLVILIFDNRKNTELADYIKKHNEEHKEWREHVKSATLAHEKRLDKTDEILQRLVDNDIEHEKRLAKLEAQK